MGHHGAAPSGGAARILRCPGQRVVRPCRLRYRPRERPPRMAFHSCLFRGYLWGESWPKALAHPLRAHVCLSAFGDAQPRCRPSRLLLQPTRSIGCHIASPRRRTLLRGPPRLQGRPSPQLHHVAHGAPVRWHPHVARRPRFPLPRIPQRDLYPMGQSFY